MMIFPCVNTEYFYTAFLPNRRISLSFVHSKDLDKHFLCMRSCDKNSKPLTLSCNRRYHLAPLLSYYKALPYKRQSSISKFRRTFYYLATNDFGFPWFNKHESLDKIKGFYLNYKKHYVAVSHSSTSPDLWVESMGNPVYLFSQIGSYNGSYSLCPTWCHYLICFLRGDPVLSNSSGE